MASVFIANDSKMELGGGVTFVHNFIKGLGKDRTSNLDEADIYFIPSASMVNKESVEEAEAKGKKIILRLDNACLNSRNRNTGMSRMKKYAGMASKVIYQSEWAREYLEPFLQTEGKSVVILNGADTNTFKPEGEKIDRNKDDEVFLYVRQNRSETKGWHLVFYHYQMIQRVNPRAVLWLVGAFSPELVQYNFDFYAGERYRYFGSLSDPTEMAKIYRSAEFLLYPYFCDAMSNSAIEAVMSELVIHDVYGMTGTGGMPEILEAYQKDKNILSLDYMIRQYLQVIENL